MLYWYEFGEVGNFIICRCGGSGGIFGVWISVDVVGIVDEC